MVLRLVRNASDGIDTQLNSRSLRECSDVLRCEEDVGTYISLCRDQKSDEMLREESH